MGHEHLTLRTVDKIVENPLVDFGESLVEGLTKPEVVGSVASVTIDTDAVGYYVITGLENPVMFNAPIGTMRQGRRLVIRIKDNGTSQMLLWFTGAGGFRASVDGPLPTGTQAGKTMYALFIYNLTDNMWDLLATRGNF